MSGELVLTDGLAGLNKERLICRPLKVMLEFMGGPGVADVECT